MKWDCNTHGRDNGSTQDLDQKNLRGKRPLGRSKRQLKHIVTQQARYVQQNIMARSRNHCCNGSANNAFCVYRWDKYHCQQYENIVYYTYMLLWRIRVAGKYKRCLGFHVMCPIVLSDFLQIWSFSTNFHRRVQYQISRKSFQWQPRCYMRAKRTNGRTLRSL